MNLAPRTFASRLTQHFTAVIVVLSPLASSPVLGGFEAGVLPLAPVPQVSQQVRRGGGSRPGVLGRTRLDNRPGPKVRTEESSERCEGSEKIFTEKIFVAVLPVPMIFYSCFLLSGRRACAGPIQCDVAYTGCDACGNARPDACDLILLRCVWQQRDSTPRGWFQWYCRFFSGRRTAVGMRDGWVKSGSKMI